MIDRQVRRFGRVVLLFVLVALGLWIRSGARVLLVEELDERASTGL